MGEDQPEATCVRTLADGSHVTEMDTESIKSPTLKLHCASDLGAGFSFTWWFIHDLGARWTHVWDLLHRIVDDKDLAAGKAGLALTKCEYRHALRFRQGPFKGGGNFHNLKQASCEFFMLNGEDSLIWQLVFDDIVEQHFKDDPMRYCPEFGRNVFLWAKARLTREAAGKGEDHKDNRWWSFEAKARRNRLFSQKRTPTHSPFAIEACGSFDGLLPPFGTLYCPVSTHVYHWGSSLPHYQWRFFICVFLSLVEGIELAKVGVR